MKLPQQRKTRMVKFDMRATDELIAKMDAICDHYNGKLDLEKYKKLTRAEMVRGLVDEEYERLFGDAK